MGACPIIIPVNCLKMNLILNRLLRFEKGLSRRRQKQCLEGKQNCPKPSDWPIKEQQCQQTPPNEVEHLAAPYGRQTCTEEDEFGNHVAFWGPWTECRCHYPDVDGEGVSQDWAVCKHVQLATMRSGERTFCSACLLSKAEMISDKLNADARMGRRRTGDVV